MSNPTPGVAFNLNAKNLVVPTAVVTATVIGTIGTLHVVGDLVAPPLRKLTARMERRVEKLENSK